jgi:hypothetical protein
MEDQQAGSPNFYLSALQRSIEQLISEYPSKCQVTVGLEGEETNSAGAALDFVGFLFCSCPTLPFPLPSAPALSSRMEATNESRATGTYTTSNTATSL